MALDLLLANIIKAACLQSEFWHEQFCFELRIVLRKMLRDCDRADISEPSFCGSKIPRKIPAKFPCSRNQKRSPTSAGVQGQQLRHQKNLPIGHPKHGGSCKIMALRMSDLARKCLQILFCLHGKVEGMTMF